MHINAVSGALRLALGATRLSIARSWVSEMLILASAGGALGMVVAYWIARNCRTGAR